MRRLEDGSANAAPTLTDVCAVSDIVIANDAAPGGGLKEGSGDPEMSTVNDADAVLGGDGETLDVTSCVSEGDAD